MPPKKRRVETGGTNRSWVDQMTVDHERRLYGRNAFVLLDKFCL
mgnify:FL=1